MGQWKEYSVQLSIAALIWSVWSSKTGGALSGLTGSWDKKETCLRARFGTPCIPQMFTNSWYFS
jgi:hypothetical protein